MKSKDEVTSNISAILLAAGESSRMGKLKQLLPFGQVTVIEACISNLLSSKVAEVIVVLGHRADEIAPLIKSYNVRVVVNADYLSGMSTSIREGVKAVNEHTTAIMFALVDKPLVSAAIIDSIIDTYNTAPPGKRIVIPMKSGKGGHPTIFDFSLRDDLLTLDPLFGLRQLKERRADEVLYLPTDDPSVIEDMNYPEDYERQLARLRLT